MLDNIIGENMINVSLYSTKLLHNKHKLVSGHV